MDVSNLTPIPLANLIDTISVRAGLSFGNGAVWDADNNPLVFIGASQDARSATDLARESAEVLALFQQLNYWAMLVTQNTVKAQEEAAQATVNQLDYNAAMTVIYDVNIAPNGYSAFSGQPANAPNITNGNKYLYGYAFTVCSTGSAAANGQTYQQIYVIDNTGGYHIWFRTQIGQSGWGGWQPWFG